MLAQWNGYSDWDRPFAALGDLRREMERLFWEFERGADARGPWRSSTTGGGWPRIELSDNGAELHLRAEVPGLADKDLNITVEADSLTLRGERKPNVPEGYSVHRQERPAMAFARSFTLPVRIDPEKVAATLKDGVLEMTLPKVAEAQPRRIQVKAA